MAASQKELAESLGVSAMTVSRALRGGEGISDQMRARVLAAARDAGLAAPPAAKHLRDNGLLHVLCTIAPAPTPDSAFHGRLLEGLRRGAKECASEMVNYPETDGTWPLIVMREQVDGAIMVWGDEHDPGPASACPLPAVFVFYGPPAADLVTVDNFGGAMALGRYLGQAGHRHVAFVGPNSRVALERFAGFRAGIEEQGGEISRGAALLRRGGGGRQASFAEDLLAARAHEDFSAVMAYNDFTAARLIAELADHGIHVPRDISVVGFDGVVSASYAGPELCTCVVPLEELGAEAARMVYWRIEHPTAVRRQVSLQTTLRPGASVRRLG